jgi:hypothetical protein
MKRKKLLEINKNQLPILLNNLLSISDVNYATRNAHAKTYAVAKGTFWVDPSIPESLQPFFDKENLIS